MMKVRIQTQGFTLTPTIATRVHGQMERLLDRYGEDIISIDAYLKGLNGPKSGFDKLAVVRYSFDRQGGSNLNNACRFVQSDRYLCSSMPAFRSSVDRQKETDSTARPAIHCGRASLSLAVTTAALTIGLRR